MECNINEQGAKIRRRMGIVLLLLALAAGVAAWALSFWWFWVVAALMVGGGSFALFESRNKWCALRAMGVKTKF